MESSKKNIHDFFVTDYISLSSDFFFLRLLCEKKLPPIYPGQFVQVEVKSSLDNFLRIPISIHDVDVDENSLSLLIQKVGSGTHALDQLKVGKKLNLIYPLGHGFDLNIPSNANVLLIGGGCGIAPLLYTARILKEKGIRTYTLMGGRNRRQILRTEEFVKYGRLDIMTEDGAMGGKGRVTDHPILQKEKFTHIYTCGPLPMMKAVARYADEHGVFCQVSLENTMACGFGACLCCVTPTQSGHQCVCTQGPVFDYKELKGFLD